MHTHARARTRTHARTHPQILTCIRSLRTRPPATRSLRTRTRLQEFGILYCFTNVVFTGKVFGERLGVPALWQALFGNTTWMALQPHSLGPTYGFYQCCATFFVRGALIKQHASSQYEQVLANLLTFCRNQSLVAQAKVSLRYPAAQLMEGTWHLMLSGQARIQPPPWCPAATMQQYKAAAAAAAAAAARANAATRVTQAAAAAELPHSSS